MDHPAAEKKVVSDFACVGDRKTLLTECSNTHRAAHALVLVFKLELYVKASAPYLILAEL
jgi:hypothetical protein